MNEISSLFSYINSFYIPYSNFTQSFLGLCIHYIILFSCFIYLGKILRKIRGKSTVIFLILGIIYIFLIPKNEFTTMLRVVALGAFIWGMDFKETNYNKKLLIIPVLLAFVQFLLVNFFYTPILGMLGTNIETVNFRILAFSCLTLLGAGIGYFLIHKYLRSEKWFSDLLLALVLFFYLPLHLLN
jgi:hypothetical protein